MLVLFRVFQKRAVVELELILLLFRCHGQSDFVACRLRIFSVVVANDYNQYKLHRWRISWNLDENPALLKDGGILDLEPVRVVFTARTLIYAPQPNVL